MHLPIQNPVLKTDGMTHDDGIFEHFLNAERCGHETIKFETLVRAYIYSILKPLTRFG